MAKANDIEGLDCAAAAGVGVATVLHTRLVEMCALRTAALDWSDPEGVHDMRVASRRLRSALRDFAPYLRHRLPQRRLRRLAAALGAVRDDDVALIALEALAHEVEAELTAGLSLLVAARQQRRAQSRAVLARALEETAFDVGQTKLARKLSQAIAVKAKLAVPGVAGADALTFADIGRDVLTNLSAELFAEGRALYQPQRVRRIHELRITAKRLRYALELFAPCWDTRLTICADEIGALQKSLGELHDCDVWIAELGGLLKQSCKRPELATIESAARTAEHKAAVWLLSRFVKDRAKYFRAALDGWETLCAHDFRAQLLGLIRLAPVINKTQSAPIIDLST